MYNLYSLPVVFDKFAHSNNFTSQQMQSAPFMTITPGDLKVEFVYINWRTGPPSQPLGDRALIGPWVGALTSLHKKSNPNLGKGLVVPSLLGEYLMA